MAERTQDHTTFIELKTGVSQGGKRARAACWAQVFPENKHINRRIYKRTPSREDGMTGKDLVLATEGILGVG